MSGLFGPATKLGLLGVAAIYALSQSDARQKSKAEWQNQFSRWAGPASETEDEKVQRTERMVKQTLDKSSQLADRDLKIISQGSSVNNTNIRLGSDLDLVIIDQQPWLIPAPGEQLPQGRGGANASFASEYNSFRKKVYGALETKFWTSGIEDGAKCIKLKETLTSRVPCDVLPCFRLLSYLPRSRWSGGVPRYNEGIVFLTGDEEQIVSFPEQHLRKGRMKNLATGYRYKQVVRVLKKFKADFQDQMSLLTWSEFPSSFEIECLVYNVPESVLMEGDLFSSVIKSLDWIKHALSDTQRYPKLLRVNNIECIFPYRQRQSTVLTGGQKKNYSDPSVSSDFVERILRKVADTI